MWDYVLVFEIQGKYSLHRMEPRGLLGLQAHQSILWELLTGTVNSWQYVITVTSSLHQMEFLGTIGLLEHQIISMRSLLQNKPIISSEEPPLILHSQTTLQVKFHTL